VLDYWRAYAETMPDPAFTETVVVNARDLADLCAFLDRLDWNVRRLLDSITVHAERVQDAPSVRDADELYSANSALYRVTTDVLRDLQRPAWIGDLLDRGRRDVLDDDLAHFLAGVDPREGGR